jgi:branched-chain amino acid transport system permease protein
MPIYLAGFDVVGLLQQVVSGVAQGAIFSSLALALVLIYRAMNVINFAQGEMAMFSTFVAFSLITGLHVSYWLAFPLTILISFLGGVVVQRIAIRPFEGSPALTMVVVTLGLFFIVNGSAGLIWGYLFQTFPSPFPASPVNLGGVYVGIRDLGVMGIVLAVLAAIYALLQHTKLGLAMRAAALYPESTRLLGVRVGWMLALGWGLAAAAGAVAGMMVAPIVFLDPNMMQPILLYAFAAAVLGGIESPIGSVVGGVVVGVALALSSYLPGAQNIRNAIALVIIVAVLVVRPSGLFGRAQVTKV